MCIYLCSLLFLNDPPFWPGRAPAIELAGCCVVASARFEEVSQPGSDSNAMALSLAVDVRAREGYCYSRSAMSGNVPVGEVISAAVSRASCRRTLRLNCQIARVQDAFRKLRLQQQQLYIVIPY